MENKLIKDMISNKGTMIRLMADTIDQFVEDMNIHDGVTVNVKYPNGDIQEVMLIMGLNHENTTMVDLTVWDGIDYGFKDSVIINGYYDGYEINRMVMADER